MAYIDDTAPVGAALAPLEIPARQSRRLLLCGLLFAFIFAGLFGRDPWKPDEAYTMGIVHHIVRTGEWVVPRLAGEPFMEKPPLFYVTAAAFAKRILRLAKRARRRAACHRALRRADAALRLARCCNALRPRARARLRDRVGRISRLCRPRAPAVHGSGAARRPCHGVVRAGACPEATDARWSFRRVGRGHRIHGEGAAWAGPRRAGRARPWAAAGMALAGLRRFARHSAARVRALGVAVAFAPLLRIAGAVPRMVRCEQPWPLRRLGPDRPAGESPGVPRGSVVVCDTCVAPRGCALLERAAGAFMAPTGGPASPRMRRGDAPPAERLMYRARGLCASVLPSLVLACRGAAPDPVSGSVSVPQVARNQLRQRARACVVACLACFHRAVAGSTHRAARRGCPRLPAGAASRHRGARSSGDCGLDRSSAGDFQIRRRTPDRLGRQRGPAVDADDDDLAALLGLWKQLSRPGRANQVELARARHLLRQPALGRTAARHARLLRRSDHGSRFDAHRRSVSLASRPIVAYA